MKYGKARQFRRFWMHPVMMMMMMMMMMLKRVIDIMKQHHILSQKADTTC